MLKKLISTLVPPATPEQFTAEAVSFIESLGRNVQVEAIEPLALKVTLETGKSSDIHLENAYASYLANRSSRKQIIAGFIQSILDVDGDETLLPKNVIPTIKDKGYVLEVRAHVAAKKENPEEFFVTEEYNEELMIVYAVDSPASIRYLNARDLPELNLHGETLRSFAIRNLQQILPGIEVHGSPPCFALKAGGMFESALLLLDRVWNKDELRISGEIVVAVPSRETLLVADGNHEKAVAQLRKTATEIARTAPYRLTDKLFVRRDGHFELLLS